MKRLLLAVILLLTVSAQAQWTWKLAKKPQPAAGGATPAFGATVLTWAGTTNGSGSAENVSVNLANATTGQELAVILSNLTNTDSFSAVSLCGTSFTVGARYTAATPTEEIWHGVCASNITAGVDNMQITTTTGLKYKMAVVMSASNVTTIDGSASSIAQTFGTTHSLPITTTNANDIIFFATIFDSAATQTINGSFTSGGTQLVHAGAGYTMAYGYRVVSSANTYDPAVSTNVNKSGNGAIIAFK